MSDNYLLFVYGTLKAHFSNSYKMEGAVLIHDKVSTTEAYPLLIHGQRNVPYLLNLKGQGHKIVGNLYQVSDSHLKELDTFEGVHNFHYDRIRVVVHTPDDKDRYECWMYVKCDTEHDHFRHLLSSQPILLHSTIGRNFFAD